MKLKTKLQTYFFVCFLIFFSFGLKFIWKRGIGHVGHHQWRWENPSHFTHAPFLPTSSFGQHANIFWQIYSNLLWTTCKYILANILPTSFRQHADISCTSFGHHSDIFGQILNFPSFFWTTCKYIFANILPTSFGHHADIFLLYFPSSL